MSLILDALNKADQERSEKREVPNLRAVHGSPYPQAQPGFLMRWRVEIVVVTVLLLAYLSYQLSVGSDEPLPGAQTPLQSRPALAAAQVAAPRPPSASNAAPGVAVSGIATEPAPVAVAAPDTVATVVPVAKESGTPSVQPFLDEPAQPSLKSQLDLKSLYAQQRGNAVAPDSEASRIPVVALPASAALPIDPPQQQRATDAGSSLTARLEKLPMLSELSAQKQRAIPSIDYSLHVYSIERDTGFVTLNGQRRRRGDQVAPGLRLENIVEDFIVLSYQGSKFRLLSLNSWINLE